jgi:hypothetical protein
MENILENANPSRGRNSVTIDADYSIYSLIQLFEARYWIDDSSEPNRGKPLEEEIRKRCAHIRERINGKPSAGAGSRSRFRPYGLIFGIAFLCASIGPYVVVECLDMVNVMGEVYEDKGSLSGIWALLTLPFAVIVFLIGGRTDSERIVKWFNL